MLNDRRRFLKQLAAAAAGSCTLPMPAMVGAQSRPSAGANGHEPVATYAFGSCIWVRINERVFTCYRTEASQKYPYFYPVVGPASGLPMTAETELPWPHHRSLFLACDKVNGGNYWQEPLDHGQIVSTGISVAPADPQRAVINDRCEWRRPGENAIIDDRRQYTITAPTPDLRFVDADVTLRARADVQINKTNHSFFSIRAARDLAPVGGGALINALSQTGEKATFGQAATWCGFYGTRLGITESIVLMDHPENPWSPCPWFTRDYGFISPTPFNWLDEKGWRLPAGESVRVRYRVVVSKGAIIVDEMNRIFKAWTEACRSN